MSEDPRHLLGKMGENLACAELERLGYAILATRYRTRFGEIDIVARHEGFTVFVEVKTRNVEDYGGGAEAVTPSKQRRIARMAVEFLRRQESPVTPCRFDVVVIEMGVCPIIEVFENAFDSSLNV